MIQTMTRGFGSVDSPGKWKVFQYNNIIMTRLVYILGVYSLGGASGALWQVATRWRQWCTKKWCIKMGPFKIFFDKIYKYAPNFFFWPRKNLASKNWGVRPRKLQPLIPGLLVVIGAWNLCRNDRFWKTNRWPERRGSPSTRREVTAEGFWRDQEGAWKNLDKTFFFG